MTRERPAAVMAALVIALAVALTGCGRGGETQQPRDGKAGLQLTGTLHGRQLAVSDGSPLLRVEDCDLQDGADDDVCAVARDLDGGMFELVFENPDVLEAGAVLPVTAGCASRQACDAVRDAAVVRLRSGDGRRLAATGGQVRVTAAEPGRRRFAGTLRLVLPGGTLTGTFDLVPRPERR